MPITQKIIDLYLAQGRNLIPEKNQIPIKGHKKGKTYTKQQLLAYVKKGYNLGWVLGPHDLVFDVDPRNGGLKTYKRLLRKLGLSDFAQDYPTVKTGGGGWHFYMRLPVKFNAKQFRVDVKKLAGVELKHAGLKVTIAGSIHAKTGKPYLIDRKSPFRRKPKAIQKALLKKYYKPNGAGPPKKNKKTLKQITTKQLYRLLKCLPVEDYALHEDWLNIMMAAHSATAGKGLKAFLKWSTKDPTYASDIDLIAARWQSLKANDGITVRTLLKEVRKYDKSIKLKDLTEFKELLSNDLGQQLVWSMLSHNFAGGKYLMHSSDQRYWRYTGTHWNLLAPNLVSQKLLKEINVFKHKNPDVKRSAASMLSDCERILRATAASDQNLNHMQYGQSIINTKNFELWLEDETGAIELKKHSYKSNLTYCLDTDYDPVANCPIFDQALDTIFCGDKEMIRHYWEIVGYAIQQKKNIPVWVLFQGPGANGKKVLLQVPSALMGSAVVAKSIDELDTRRNSHALADLPGTLAIIDDDVDANAKLPDGMLKKLSENKPMNANPKHTATFEFTNTAIVIMAANNWPRTQDVSFGMRRRALVFQLKRTFKQSEQDLNLAEKVINTELAGVLNKALAGYQRLRKRGYFKIPEKCKQAADVWFSASSQIHQYISDCLLKSERSGATLKFVDVWERYLRWASNQGINSKFTYSKSFFKNKLIDLKIKVRKGGSNWLVIQGYQFSPEEED